MRGRLTATTLIAVCLLPFPNLSSPLFASVVTSYCDLETIRQTEIETATITNIYVSETNGAILEVCVDTNDAKLSITEQGEMTLLRRDPAFEIDYYDSGPREDSIRRIGAISFDYYTNSSRKGKIKRIGSVIFNYYRGGDRIGRLKQIGDIRIEYYTSGFREGKLKRIGDADFDYDRQGRMETDGPLSNVNITIVDFVDRVDPQPEMD